MQLFLNRKPCDVVYRFTEDGEKVRVSKRTGQIIPIPPDAEETVDYAKKSAYKRLFIIIQSLNIELLNFFNQF